MGKKRLSRCDHIKNLVMGRLSWVVQIGGSSIITEVLIRKTQEVQRKKDLKILMSKLSASKMVRGPQEKNMSSLWKLEKTGKQIHS